MIFCFSITKNISNGESRCCQRARNMQICRDCLGGQFVLKFLLLRASLNGKAVAFQAEAEGSNPFARSIL